MTLGELTRQIKLGQQLSVEVRSYEPSLYLAFCVTAQTSEPLCDEHGRPLRFFARHKAFKALREAGLRQVEFVHQSAYSEMIGTDQGTMQDSEFRQRIDLVTQLD